MTRAEAAEYAISLFNNGYNCAESTLLAAVKYAGLEDMLPSPRIATALGGGFGRAQLACGILTGGVLAIGLKFGRDDAAQSREEAYTASRAYTAAFTRIAAHADCRAITGVDMNDPEQLAQMRREHGSVHHNICAPLLSASLDALLSILDGE